MLGPGRLANHPHARDLIALEHEDRRKIVDVSEDELQVLDLTGAAQVSDALADEAGFRGRPAPAPDEFLGPPIFEYVTGLGQPFRNPGAAHLVLLAKLAAATRPDQGDAAVTVREMGRKCAVVAKASKVDSV